MLKGFAVATCLCVTAVAEAEPSRLSGQELSDLVAGATIEIDAPLGTKVPLRYARDGQVSGQARDLAPYLGSATDTGKWWVAADQLCHKWKLWFNGEPQCFRLRKEGRTIHWRTHDGNTGTAAIVVPAPPVAPPIQIAAAVPPPAPPARALPASQPESARPGASIDAPPVPRPAVRPDATKQAAAQSTDEKGPATPVPNPAAGSAPGAQSDGQPRTRPQPPPAPEPAFKVINVARDDVLNVRKGPSADFDVVGAIEPGSRGVTVTGACQSRWCPVEHRSARGWVNSVYLAREEPLSPLPVPPGPRSDASPDWPVAMRDAPDAPRTCLAQPARALLDRIEEKFGPVQVISTCRPGAMIPGTGLPSRHASGNAVDFNAGSRKGEIVEWLIANHNDGGVMTYADMDHIHVDIGRRFVSIAGGQHWASWHSN